nr:hypothetical protein [Actinomycetota bacterium]NIU18532.1 hypothetical protein [Actinomycetota bacterium]NIU65383.1 hypothetical protein [Actinomycetota bacterium]NIV86376.1 hypothetical protein [Actinomycetota bacterium]NIW27181.1 hypothetical protein [Actinomycetota bacterium]
MRAGVVAVARPTFDVEFAAETARRAYRVLEGTGWELAGSADLVMDGDGLDAAISDLSAEGIDGLVVLQASFADSTLVAPLSALGVPMVLWAFPEDRTGGRLRINSLCGINLAGYALSLGDTTYGFLYRDPDDPAVSQELADAFAGSPASKPRAAHADGAVAERAAEIAARLRDTKVGVIGDRPDGFEPCGFDAELTASVIGPRIEKRELPATFAAASAVAPVEIAPLRETVGERLAGIDDVDQEEVD